MKVVGWLAQNYTCRHNLRQNNSKACQQRSVYLRKTLDPPIVSKMHNSMHPFLFEHLHTRKTTFSPMEHSSTSWSQAPPVKPGGQVQMARPFIGLVSQMASSWQGLLTQASSKWQRRPERERSHEKKYITIFFGL